MKKKIVSIVGARPNFIKLAALHPALKSTFEHVIVHTGQHYNYKLSQEFFNELAIPAPNFNLEIGSHIRRKQIILVRGKTIEILKVEKPNIVIVYGDTNSTLGGALAAHRLKIAIAHVESGLRSYDNSLPEELNRVKTDRISNLLFCSSLISVDNLKKEGITEGVHLTGDVMRDIFIKTIPNNSILTKHNLEKRNYYFSTIHRQSNTNNKINLKSIFSTLSGLDKIVIMPIHPRTKKAIFNLKIKFKNIKLINPVNYSQSIALQMNAKTIITDSGGIQKEAYWLKVPCITLRNSTEWPETIVSGWNKLVGTKKPAIREAILSFKKPLLHYDLYGDGHTSAKICSILENYL